MVSISYSNEYTDRLNTAYGFQSTSLHNVLSCLQSAARDVIKNTIMATRKKDITEAHIPEELELSGLLPVTLLHAMLIPT